MRLFHLRFRYRPEKPISVIFGINFLTALAVAVVTPFLALYFATFVPMQDVGFILAGASVISILANIFGGSIIARLHERRTTTLALLGVTVAIAVLGFAGHIAVLATVFSLYTFLFTLLWFNIDLYVKHFSDAKTLGGNEGKLGVTGNLGWLIGPFLGGFIAARYDLPAIFICSALFSLIALLLFIEVRPHDSKGQISKHQHFTTAIKEFLKDVELKKLYVISFGLAFLYGCWQFVPLLLGHAGASLTGVGIIYGLSALPWVLFEYPVGQMAGNRFGERAFIIAGYSIVTVASFAFGFTRSLPWLVVALFVGVTGTSLIERTHITAFFRRVNDADVEHVSVWRTSFGLGHILGPLIASIILSFASLEFFFAFAGVVSLLFLAAALGLRVR